MLRCGTEATHLIFADCFRAPARPVYTVAKAPARPDAEFLIILFKNQKMCHDRIGNAADGQLRRLYLNIEALCGGPTGKRLRVYSLEICAATQVVPPPCVPWHSYYFGRTSPCIRADRIYPLSDDSGRRRCEQKKPTTLKGVAGFFISRNLTEACQSKGGASAGLISGRAARPTTARCRIFAFFDRWCDG